MDLTYKRKLSLLGSINELAEAIEQGQSLAPENFADLKDAFLALGVHPNHRLLELTQIISQNGAENHRKDFCRLFNRFYDAQIIAANASVTVSGSYTSQHLGCDREFGGYVKLIRDNSIEALNAYVFNNLKELQKSSPALYTQLTVGYRGWYFEDNHLEGVDSENNSLIANRMNTLKNNIDKICALYDMLGDNLSRVTLNALIHNWLTFSPTKMLAAASYLREAVDVNLFPIYDDEVFVDCGSYVGDTVMEYCNQANMDYKRIYTYDISSSTVERMKQNLKQLSNIVYNVKGVGEFPDTLEILGTDKPFEGNKLVKAGSSNTRIQVPVVKLDDDIAEPVSFLKIDVEGLDKEAIRGARAQIQRNHPKLAIDAYHRLIDFFEIPHLIHEIDASYTIFLRIANNVENPLYFPRPSIYAI